MPPSAVCKVEETQKTSGVIQSISKGPRTTSSNDQGHERDIPALGERELVLPLPFLHLGPNGLVRVGCLTQFTASNVNLL